MHSVPHRLRIFRRHIEECSELCRASSESLACKVCPLCFVVYILECLDCCLEKLLLRHVGNFFLRNAELFKSLRAVLRRIGKRFHGRLHGVHARPGMLHDRVPLLISCCGHAHFLAHLIDVVAVIRNAPGSCNKCTCSRNARAGNCSQSCSANTCRSGKPGRNATGNLLPCGLPG